MCCVKYIVLVNENLAKNATLDSVLLLALQKKYYHLYNQNHASNKMTTLTQAYKCIFRPENGF